MVAKKWTEQRLRDHLWSHRQRFHDLMDPLPAEVRETLTLEISSLTPTQLLQSLTFRRLVDVYDQVASLTLLGREVRLAPIARSGMYVERGEHPLFGDDFPEHAAAMSQSHYYFRTFLSRMMQEGGLL